MGLTEFQIFFDNQWGTYYGGQTVTGSVKLTLDSPKTARAVTIEFKGEAETSWSESHTRTDSQGKRHTQTVHYGANETYFKVKWPLIGSESGSKMDIPIGTHIFPFTYALPLILPSSFEGNYGHIRYTCKVNIDRPWKFDQDTKAAMTVLRNVDLNPLVQYHAPVTITDHKYFCCCWCRSGPLACTVAVPCTGYVPGQTINVAVEVDNASNVQVYAVHVYIKKSVIFRAAHSAKTKESTDKVIEQRFGAVQARSNANYHAQLKLPALPPSGLDCCSIIDLDYELHTEVMASGLHSNLTVRIPLVIGTVPFMQAPSIMAPSAPIHSTSASAPLLGGNGEIPDAPPSYEKCQFGTTSIKDSSDTNHTRFSGDGAAFSPNYPVFHPVS